MSACAHHGSPPVDTTARDEKCAGFEAIVIPRADALVISTELFDRIIIHNEFGKALKCPYFE